MTKPKKWFRILSVIQYGAPDIFRVTYQYGGVSLDQEWCNPEHHVTHGAEDELAAYQREQEHWRRQGYTQVMDDETSSVVPDTGRGERLRGFCAPF